MLSRFRPVAVHPPFWNAKEKHYEWIDSSGNETSGTVEEWAAHAEASTKRQIETIVKNENAWQQRMREDPEEVDGNA